MMGHLFHVTWTTYILLFSATHILAQLGAEKQLYRQLMDDYEPYARPVINPNTTVVVKLGVKVNQLLDLNERTQVLTTIVAIDQTWDDVYLKWDPDLHSGIQRMYLPCSKVWLPDIVLYNSVDGIHENMYMKAPISVDYEGHVTWFPLAKLTTNCKLDTRFYPFDHQACYLKLGSWSYSVHEVDIQDGGFTGIEKPDFVDNGEFELMEFKVERVKNHYDCCPDPIITLNVVMHFKRRPLFSMFTVAIPCIMLSLMTIIAFILPPDNEAKIEVQLSVMLSLAVFMLLIGESLPPTSDKIPLIGVHIVIQMGLTALSLICSVLVLRLVSTDYIDVPETLRKRAVWMARWLCIGVPDYLKDSHKLYGKLGLLEKHQIELRQKTMAETNRNGLNADAFGVRFAMEELRCQTTPLLTNGGRMSTGSSTSSKQNGSPATINRNQKDVAASTTACCHCAMLRESNSVISMNVSRILQHLDDSVIQEQRVAEWRMLGALIDRMLLLILTAVVILTTIYIYFIAPALNSETIQLN